MKKSQVAAALALTYVAGSLFPVPSIYAEAVLDDRCTPSADAATASNITDSDIARIVLAVKQQLPVYDAYKKILDIKAEYSARGEDNKTLATIIDEAVAAATATLTAADSDLAAAQANYDNYNLTDLSSKIKQLARGYDDTSKTLEEMVADIHTAVASYDKYVTIREKIAANDLSSAKQLIVELSAEVNGFFGNDTTLGAIINATDISTINSLMNAGGQGLATHYSRLYLEEKNANGIITARDTAKAKRDEALKAKAEAEEKQAAAINEITEAADAIAELGKDVNVKSRGNVVNTLKFIKEKDTYGGIADLDLMSDFINYLESGVEGENAEVAYTTISGYLSLSTIATEDVKESILNPMAIRKICDANGVASIEGLLPTEKLVIRVERVADDTPIKDLAVADKTQAAYDITLEYMGQPYVVTGDEYKVTVNVPAEMDGNTTTVYHVDGDIRNVQPSKYDAENNTITFTTNHFSRYVLVGSKKAEDPAYAYRTLFDDQYGVAVYGSFKADAEYKLRVTEMAEHFTSDDEQFNAELDKATKVFYRIEVFEITADGQEVKVNLMGQEVVIAIALPESMDADREVAVYFGEEDNDILSRVEDALLDQDARLVTFVTDQLGDYALVQLAVVEDNNQPVVNPGDNVDQPIITKPTVEVPNTGIAAKTSAGSAEAMSATSGIIVNALALAGAAVAMVVRFVRRRQA